MTQQTDVFAPSLLGLPELFGIGLGCFIVVTTTWQALTHEGAWLGRIYWRTCGLVMWLGIAGLIYASLKPSDRFDGNGYLIGELPAEFAVMVALIALALCASLVGFFVMAIGWLHGRVRRQER